MTYLRSDFCAVRAFAQAEKCLRGRVGRAQGKRDEEAPATSVQISGSVSTACKTLRALRRLCLL